ncbi:MAG: hypothetical protein GY696_29975, partial [Gammaproteobacteria bacterium]|nr:hypothetical protein [Gammaproteobacteria bacterium]
MKSDASGSSSQKVAGPGEKSYVDLQSLGEDEQTQEPRVARVSHIETSDQTSRAQNQRADHISVSSEESPASVHSAMLFKLRALNRLIVPHLRIYRPQKAHKALSVFPSENNTLISQSRYADRLGGVFMWSRQCLRFDTALDNLSADLDDDPLWQLWSQSLSAEEKAHVRMVHESRRYARATIAMAEEHLDALSRIPPIDICGIERSVVGPGQGRRRRGGALTDCIGIPLPQAKNRRKRVREPQAETIEEDHAEPGDLSTAGDDVRFVILDSEGWARSDSPSRGDNAPDVSRAREYPQDTDLTTGIPEPVLGDRWLAEMLEAPLERIRAGMKNVIRRTDRVAREMAEL